MPQLDRREFTSEVVKALFAGVTITIAGACGDDDSSSNPTGPSGGGSSGDVAAVIGTNHGHSGSISRADLTAGGAITLDISGSAGHPHTVQLSAAEVAQIAAGTRVQKESSSDQAHSHTVTFN